MLARIVTTAAALAFGIGAFCGAGPSEITPNPFGCLFLGVAAFVWFRWDRIRTALNGPAAFDGITGNFTGRTGAGAKVPEIDTAGPRRRH